MARPTLVLGAALNTPRAPTLVIPLRVAALTCPARMFPARMSPPPKVEAPVLVVAAVLLATLALLLHRRATLSRSAMTPVVTSRLSRLKKSTASRSASALICLRKPLLG